LELEEITPVVNLEIFGNMIQVQIHGLKKQTLVGVLGKGGIGFTVGSKGYIGTGNNGTLLKDFWEYDAGNNMWTQKANFGGTARCYTVGFSIDGKGYIGTGYDINAFTNDFWEYYYLLTANGETRKGFITLLR
jgi:N-acetylneuraminic acid mutarotase